jgi:hypothetical protein
LLEDANIKLASVVSDVRGLSAREILQRLLGGVIAALLFLPVAAPWNTWITTNGNTGPAAPLVAGRFSLSSQSCSPDHCGGDKSSHARAMDTPRSLHPKSTSVH